MVLPKKVPGTNGLGMFVVGPSSLKFPECISAVGTVLMNGVSSRMSDRWIEPKMNILSFMIGPPNWPPYWFRWKPN